MQDFEKLGVFYLGRPYDLAAKKPKPGWLLYDAKDLVTHAICVGMTGSGKTGLCIALLEEAAIDGIPAIVIDPKGDLGNLLLTFPHLRPEDFLPWINDDEAKKKGLAPADFAARQAELWTKGLASWEQDGDRIARLRENADFAIYTPGSTAGIPVSILKSFAAPAQDLLDDEELLRERIGTTVTSLLGLLGIDGDPIQSREHILLSTILDQAWRKGEDLDLATLIRSIQSPPVTKVGVLDLESFYPSKNRFALAMKLNNLLAAPGFAAWLEGEALDIGQILYTKTGKPRIAVFSIAHLSDQERMFFVTLLLSQTLGWMRAQSGTSSLRALLYMDEIFGYFPPVANPPSKAPLLTLLKQARAFGLGVVLATQNPVDLDYKGLSNTGTWFIGRLQTERDRARVLDGLEGVAAGTGAKFDRRQMEQLLGGLGNRIFLLNNVHEDAPVVFETRWCLSYLRGPLTRAQIKLLTQQGQDKGEAKPGGQSAPPPSSLAAAQPSRLESLRTAPVLPSEIAQYFLPVRGSRPVQTSLLYRPLLLGCGQVRFADTKSGVDATRELCRLAAITDGPIPVNWDEGLDAEVVVADLERHPEKDAQFAPLPSSAGTPKAYAAWTKDYAAWIYRTQTITLWKSDSLGRTSTPGESERDFRIRLQQAARERRDEQAERLRKKYEPKLLALQDRLRRARAVKEREQTEARQQYVQAAISVGATILGAFLGRKTISSSTLDKATSAARGLGKSIQGARDVSLAEENEEAILTQQTALDAEFRAETESLTQASDPMTIPLDTLSIRPTKANIAVKLVALAWAPHWQDERGALIPAWR